MSCCLLHSVGIHAVRQCDGKFANMSHPIARDDGLMDMPCCLLHRQSESDIMGRIQGSDSGIGVKYQIRVSDSGVGVRDRIQGMESGIGFGDQVQGSDSGVGVRDRIQGAGSGVGVRDRIQGSGCGVGFRDRIQESDSRIRRLLDICGMHCCLLQSVGICLFTQTVIHFPREQLMALTAHPGHVDPCQNNQAAMPIGRQAIHMALHGCSFAR